MRIPWCWATDCQPSIECACDVCVAAVVGRPALVQPFGGIAVFVHINSGLLTRFTFLYVKQLTAAAGRQAGTSGCLCVAIFESTTCTGVREQFILYASLAVWKFSSVLITNWTRNCYFNGFTNTGVVSNYIRKRIDKLNRQKSPINL